MAQWIDHHLLQPEVDQYHTVLEVPCTVPLAIDGDCDANLSGRIGAVDGACGIRTYQWSNGVDGGNMLEVSAAGVYTDGIQRRQLCRHLQCRGGGSAGWIRGADGDGGWR